MPVGAGYIGFAGTFDLVNHRLLLLKLGAFSISYKLLKWVGEILMAGLFPSGSKKIVRARRLSLVECPMDRCSGHYCFCLSIVWLRHCSLLAISSRMT